MHGETVKFITVPLRAISSLPHSAILRTKKSEIPKVENNNNNNNNGC
jgi:hypothetical protein